MSTWTLEQVAQVKRLRARLVVDDEVILRQPDAAQRFAEDELAKALTNMGHPLGVEIHRGDFAVEWHQSVEAPWQMVGVMRWRPTTHTAELRGGHLDGQRYAIRNVGEPLRIPRPAVTPWLDTDLTHATAAVTEMVDTYNLVGWREDERVWVYAIA